LNTRRGVLGGEGLDGRVKNETLRELSFIDEKGAE
jgi:hypothetical protein